VAGSLESGDSLYPDQGNGGYDVSHYDLDLTWEPGPPGGTIDAVATITAATTGPPLSSFGLDFEGDDLDVTSVEVNGAGAAFSRLDEADGTTPGKHKLVVTPATPVGGAFTVVVDYDGTPSLRGGETAGSDEGWIATPDGASFLNQPIGSMTGFPNNNTPKDKATYTISVTVPDTYEVASNGELTAIPPVGGPRTWVWTESQPMASELVLISIGQFDVTQSTVTLSGNRVIPEWSFVDSALSPTSKATFTTQRLRLSAVLTGLESFLGPYPGHSTGIVLDATGVGYALETQDRPTWSTAGFIADSFEHELTHQWYGDAVAPGDWNGLWVNEGMATWAPEHLNGTNQAAFFGEWSTTPASSNRWRTPPSAMTTPSQLFGWQSYDRGAMTYEALRATIGDPAFFQLIKQWQTDFKGQTKRWTDLVALAEQIAGRDLTAFFQDWLCDADKPAWPPAAPTPSGTPCVPPLTGPPPTTPPAPAPPGTAFGAECQVRIHGRPRVGHRVTGRLDGCPAGAAATSYRWFAGSKPIKGAARATYRVKRSTLGKRISVRVTVTAPGYAAATRVSPPTRRVRR
jgi:aminopeptidase N